MVFVPYYPIETLRLLCDKDALSSHIMNGEPISVPGLRSSIEEEVVNIDNNHLGELCHHFTKYAWSAILKKGMC